MTTPFVQLAPKVMAGLIHDLAITDLDAAGILGNLGEESGLQAIQEIHPRAGRGGFGWPQWTGTRRVAFETYCKKHGLATTSETANYGYLLFELRGPYAHALTQLRRCTTVAAATQTFETYYEMAGIVNLVGRVKFANQALALYRASVPAPIQAPKEALVDTTATQTPALAANSTTALTNMLCVKLVGLIWPELVAKEPLLNMVGQDRAVAMLESIVGALVNTVIAKFWGAAAVSSVPGAVAPMGGQITPATGFMSQPAGAPTQPSLSDILQALGNMQNDIANLKGAQPAQPSIPQISGPTE